VERADYHESLSAKELVISQTRSELGQALANEQDTLWNEPVFDIAFAVRLTGADSSGKNMSGDKYRAWATIGTGVKTWGQFLFGASIGGEREERDHDWTEAGSYTLKANLGRNSLRMFVEGDLSYVEYQRVAWLANTGLHWRAVSGWWITAGVGLENPDNRSTWGLRTNFSLKFGVPKTIGT
jgi:hypothetical protein